MNCKNIKKNRKKKKNSESDVIKHFFVVNDCFRTNLFICAFIVKYSIETEWPRIMATFL